jgi:hypothetical protein
MSWEGLIFLTVYAMTALLIFLGRNWLKANVERSVQARFDSKLENLRTELRKNEEEFKSELRLKEIQISALRDGILSGRAQRQALVDKRRLEAVDRLWSGFMALAPFAAVSAIMVSVNFEAAAREASRNPSIRKVFQMISDTNVPDMTKISENARGKYEQPFVSPLAWAYFSAYQTVVLGAYMRAKILESGLEEPGKLFKDQYAKDVLKAALPHQAEFIDKYDMSAHHHLLDELEKRLLVELQKMLRGEDQDAAGIEQAAKIMTMVERAAAQPAAQRVSVVTAGQP